MSVRLADVASTKPLITMVMEPELLKEIDEFRYVDRFPSRAAAMKELLITGLRTKAEEKARAAAKQ